MSQQGGPERIPLNSGYSNDPGKQGSQHSCGIKPPGIVAVEMSAHLRMGFFLHEIIVQED